MSTRIVGGVFLAVGLAVASVGGFFYLGTQDLLENGLRSTGKVIQLNKPGSSRYFTPVVQFETPDHKTITASCKTGSNPPTHKVNDSVTVIFRATSPEDIYLDEPLELWLAASILGGIGSIFLLVGGGMLVWSFRPRRN